MQPEKKGGLSVRQEDNMEKLNFTLDDGSTVDFVVEGQTVIGGVTYLMVSDPAETDAQEEASSEESVFEATVYIMKDISDPDSTQACYEMVEDPEELEAVFSVFLELMDDDTV